MKLRLRPVAVPAALCLCLFVFTGLEHPARADSAAPQSGRSATGQGISTTPEMTMIPGPLRSFLRLAGISQDVQPGEVMPMLARNAYLLGYREETQTEFLRLVNRYLRQARELQILAGSSGVIHVTNCSDAELLLKVLGYRVRSTCGKPDMLLETANPTRAFLTIDSGFPLTQLEEALQTGEPFTYPYKASWVPILFKESDWVTLGAPEKRSYGNLLDTLTNDRSVARLYLALSKNDSETRVALLHSPGLKKLLPVAATLDFCGNEIFIRSGHVAVPGGTRAEAAWKDLVGASPTSSSGEFVANLLAKDNGWLAVYFDSLSRVNRSQQEHLTEPARLKRLYEAFRAPDPEAIATHGVFRKAPDLLVLFTRLEWEASGDPRIPGGLDAWKQILQQKTESSEVRDVAKRARTWDKPEQLLAAMVSFSRLQTDQGPLQMYLALSELDSRRPDGAHLSADTARLLAAKFSQLSSWYLVFTEFPELTDDCIHEFVKATEGIDRVSSLSLRGNALGAFQSSISLWQVLARQGEIPRDRLDASLRKVIEPYFNVGTSTQLFDSARSSITALLSAAGARPGSAQSELVGLLAGPRQASADGQQVRLELAGRIEAVLTDQRIVSLDTLFALSDGLDAMAKGAHASDEMVQLADELKDFEMPRQIFTRSEKVEWAPKANNGRHTELQSKIDLTRVIKSGTPAELQTARGQLAPLLRDTLVGLNYAYYEPPGAQILHINPLFVRSHDFTGITVQGSERLWQAPILMGAGISAGGGGYLMGSLADLPYSLASAEQDLISPEKVQALIWRELAPELLANAAFIRWWNVSPAELHAVSLYQRSGEELLRASVDSPALYDKATSILSDRMEPQRLEKVEQAMQGRESFAAFLPQMMPADTFYLGIEFPRRFPAEAASLGPAGIEVEALARAHPAEVGWDGLSRDFGVPHPTLTRTYARELLNLKPFPFYGAYSSRLFGETWESGNLYWARLADEMGYTPVMLNRLVPELTRRMTGKIFATSLDDWPAILRAMQEAGDELRAGKIAAFPNPRLPPPNATTSSLPRAPIDGSHGAPEIGLTAGDAHTP
jgi:hypothetical protein